MIVADDDGAVVIPQALVDFVVTGGRGARAYWRPGSVSEVERGDKLPGLYPPNDETKERYEDWKKK